MDLVGVFKLMEDLLALGFISVGGIYVVGTGIGGRFLASLDLPLVCVMLPSCVISIIMVVPGNEVIICCESSSGNFGMEETLLLRLFLRPSMVANALSGALCGWTVCLRGQLQLQELQQQLRWQK